MQKSCGMWAAVAAVGVLVGTAAAQPHDEDVFLGVQDGRIVTGVAEPEGIEWGVRVFEAEFGDQGIANFTRDPGLDSDPGTFPVPSEIGFNILQPLKRWNGEGFDLAGEKLTIRYDFGDRVEEAATGAGFISGFGIPVRESGRFHEHLGFRLDPDTLGNRADGIYLLELELFSSAAGILPSEPFWIVFEQNDSHENHELAVRWVEQNLVPEPAALGLMMFGGLALLRRVRR